MSPKVRELGAALLYGLAGWSITAVVMSIALRAVTVTNAAFATHALTVALSFGVISYAYFRRSSPLRPFVAGLFGALLLMMNAAIATVLGRTSDTRGQVLGTWLPAYAALLVTWITGVASKEARARADAGGEA